MDQVDELTRLKAELAALKLSISQKNAGPQQTDTTVPVMSVPFAPSTTAGLPAQGLHGSKHAAFPAPSSPTQPQVGQTAVAHGLGASTYNSSAITSSAQNAAPPRSSSSNVAARDTISGGPATSRLVAPLAMPQSNKKSLLGQDYMPPSNEKFARRAVVKMVPVNPPASTLRAAEQTALANKTVVNAKEGATKQAEAKATMYKEKAIKQPEEQKRQEEDLKNSEEQKVKEAFNKSEELKRAGIMAEQFKKNAHPSEMQNLKGVVECDKFQYASDDTAVTIEQNGQSGKIVTVKESSSEMHTVSAKHNEFVIKPGRRVCISNLPSGARAKDIEEIIEKKANIGHSIEAITIFRRNNGRPGYAFVDVADPKDALHIVKWMDNEHLFGWPINLRMACDMNKVTIDELMNNSSATPMLDNGVLGTEKAGYHSITCRCWLQGHCRKAVDCKFTHDSSSGSNLPPSRKVARRHYSVHHHRPASGKRNYNFSNIPLPAEYEDGEDEESIFGTSIYRPTALRILTDDI